MQFKIKNGKGLKGEITVPGDKSISHRAIMLASLAEGKSKISGFLEGEDCLATIEVFQNMGVSISKSKGMFIVEGKGLKGLERPTSPLDFRNSGTSVRLCSGVLAAQEFSSTLIGDISLSGNRILGSFYTSHTGHELNYKLIQKIFESPENWELVYSN